MRVLVVNAGSSSLKLRVIDDGMVVASTDLGAIDQDAVGDELVEAIRGLGPVEAVGHRVVHGGTRYRTPVLLDGSVVADLTRLVELAPLHQPASLAGITAVDRCLPDVPAVACFDTAFHATIPAAAATYALPADWRARWDLRRFGFHGLSHAYVARRAAELLGATPARLVTCHLGAGASLAAVLGGTCVDTTMGFTPLEGLVMATRSGSVDPGLIMWLADRGRVPLADLSDGLERRAGLLGLAGSADMRQVLDRAAAGDSDAVLARDIYVHRLRASIAAMAASLGGLDGLVFTGGVGERSVEIRSRAADGLGFLGVAIDAGANAASQPDREIGRDGAAVRTLVVAAREDLEIAAQVRSVLVDI